MSATVDSRSPRELVTRADQLPRRDHRLDRPPSEYLLAPLEALRPLAARLEAELLCDLERYDIQDPATLRERFNGLAALAQLREDWASARDWTIRARALNDKPGARLASGVLTELMAQCREERQNAGWLAAQVARRFGAMPWADVQDIVKGSRGSLETFNPELMVGAFQGKLDTLARNGQNVVPDSVVLSIVAVRVQMDMMALFKTALVEGLDAVVQANRQAAQVDLWTSRTFAIPADAAGHPVVVAIWDSGVDLALFEAAPGRGMAFDKDNQPATDLLRPLGEAAERWPRLQQLVKGAMDQRAVLDTDEARQFRAVMAALKAEQVKDFQEDLALASLYMHGTHVAGIAVEGNPFARVYVGAMLWNQRIEPLPPSEDRSHAAAAAYAAMVEGFKKADVRVVNMSWRYGPSRIEQALAFHNLGGTLEARKEQAQHLFQIESDALEAAIAGAPDILFVAGAGNEDNSADFEAYVPAGFSLPNLITVGAVDRAGAEAAFSTFGRTVVVHANGFEVEGPVPGGQRMKLSGTSMASPQVANLAAKLLALKPGLTPEQVKALILQGAQRQPGPDGQPGRVNLVHPRASAALAGIRL